MLADSIRNLTLPTLALTTLFELLTILGRILSGGSAEEWIAANNPPLLVSMHHMFWAVPVFLLAGAAGRYPRASRFLWACGVALILSDLSHHFAVLPLWVGNTGWHWP